MCKISLEISSAIRNKRLSVIFPGNHSKVLALTFLKVPNRQDSNYFLAMGSSLQRLTCIRRIFFLSQLQNVPTSPPFLGCGGILIVFEEQGKIKPLPVSEGRLCFRAVPLLHISEQYKKVHLGLERHAGDKGAANSALQCTEQVFPFH